MYKWWSPSISKQKNTSIIVQLIHVYRQHTSLASSQNTIPYCTMADKPKTKTVIEGKADIVHPASVFYNPVQEFNRDLTIAILSQFAEEQIKKKREKRKKKTLPNNEEQEVPTCDPLEDEELVAGKKYDDGLRILEGLAASGLRSMRFGLEVPGVKEIIANDFDSDAVNIIKENISRNNLDHLVQESHADAGLVMYQNKTNFESRFDVIDLDPYGSPAKFLDPCVQAVQEGGLLCVTCTDAAVLCGNFPEKCYQHYGGVPVRSAFCHEMALRIILHSIQSHAARYQKYIVPLLSLSIDFYFRLFIKVYHKPSIAKYAASNTGLVYHCTGCGSYTVQPMATFNKTEKSGALFYPARGPTVPEKCEHCGHEHRVGGPMYKEGIHDKSFVSDVLKYVRGNPEKFKTAKRIEGMLTMALEEDDIPLYYEMDEICKIVHCSPLKMMNFRSAILNAGYKVSFSHACKNSIKTNAPNSFIWDIIRTWIKDNPVNERRRQEQGSVVQKILSQEPSTEVNFDLHPDANPASRSMNLARHPLNPEKNWGPKPRARRDQDGDDMEERRLKNQGKKKRKAEELTESADNSNMEAS